MSRRKPAQPATAPNAALSQAIRKAAVETPLQKMVAIGEAYRNVYASADGKAVIDDLLITAGLLEISTAMSQAAGKTSDGVVAVAVDPFMTHFNDGRKSMGLHIFERMRWAAGELLQLSEARTQQQVEGASGADE